MMTMKLRVDSVRAGFSVEGLGGIRTDAPDNRCSVTATVPHVSFVDCYRYGCQCIVHSFRAVTTAA